MYRVEDKYCCSPNEMFLLQRRIGAVLRPDANESNPEGYSIISLYFDDLEDSCLQDTLDGNERRNKYRIRIYNNSLDMIKLEVKEKLDSNEGILPLPVITNHKTVDPTDPASDAVIQLETAMGAAIGQFDGSICLEVGRPRFLPVKTTNDLFIMRSDRFHMTDSFEMEDSNYVFPVINLDKRYYKNIADFDARFPYGIPSIAAANSVSVTGDWTFGKNITFFGDAALSDGGKAAYVPQGQFVGPNGIEDDDWE